VLVSWHKVKKAIRRLFFGQSLGGEIDPDEIFLDASNLPQFDTHQFEGRLERPISRGTFFWVVAIFLIIGFVFTGRLWGLQIKDGDAYAKRSERNRLEHTTIFANRGIIYDRKGREMAWNDLNTLGDYALRTYAPVSGIAHLIGYVKYPAKDKMGIYYEDRFIPKGGVEEYFEEDLSGENGLKITETDALGNIQSESLLTPPVDGKNIELSVDMALQEKMYSLIASTVAERSFIAGAGVMMDIHTGEVLAMTSFPEFDSNVMTRGEDDAKIKEYLNNKNNPFLNRAVGGQFIPGSIMKPYIAMGALQEEIIDPLKEILSTGQITIPNPYDPTKKTIFKDWRENGWTDMRRALAVSSNVYFFSIGGGYDGQKGIGIDNIEKYTKMFGFSSLTGIDLDGEKEGNVPSRSWKAENYEDGEWRVGDTYNSSIGQYGFQVTPIQALRAVTSIANGGFLLKPTIVKGNRDIQKKSEFISSPGEYWRILREGLRLSVTEGTAKGLYMPEISVAAKTGTAELGASKSMVNSWVMGYFPYEEPKYAFVVLMEQGPRANQIGATSIMRQLFEWMYAYAPDYVK